MAKSIKLFYPTGAQKVLNYLAQVAQASRKEIADTTGVDKMSFTSLLGSDDEATRIKNDEKNGLSLRSAGYIKAVVVEGPDGHSITEYKITARGRKAQEKGVIPARKAKDKPETQKGAEKVTKAIKAPKTGTRPDGWSSNPAENRLAVLDALYPLNQSVLNALGF